MKNREEEQRIAGRIRDLARQAAQNDYLTHTGFLSLSGQSLAAALTDPASGGTGGDRCVWFGGYPDADRKVLFFLPSYLEEEELIRQEEAGEGILSCLRITVRGARFSREIGHRDCLGALMHLGIERDQIGDILLREDGSAAYVYVLSAMADHICRELVTVGRAHVDTQIVPPASCDARPVLVERSGSVASVRIDSLVAMVFKVSRSAAQDLVDREAVFADGRTVTSASWAPGPGCRISVRGHGKFIFEGEEKRTKKGRLFVKTSVFS